MSSDLINKNLIKRRILGLAFGFLLAIIVLNVDKKLWLPLEFETINARNTSSIFGQNKIDVNNVVLILFDDKTQFLLRQGGMPIKDFEIRGRELIAEAVERLEKSNVKSIGINLNLSAPSPSDEKLKKTISKYKNIVIADSIFSLNSSSILRASKFTGYGEIFSDYDKIVHKLKLLESGYKKLPAFSYLLFKNGTGKDVDEKLKQKNEFYLRYFKTPFIKYSFVDLIQGKINPDLLKDKIVILDTGLKSKLIVEQLLSPFDKKSNIFGSEVKATALLNLITNSYLLKISLINSPVIFILVSAFLGVLFSNITLIRSLMSGISLFIGLIIFSQLSYSYLNLLIEIVPLIFLLLGNFVIGSLIFLQLNLQEQNIELEGSKLQLEDKNEQLTLAFSELSKKINELREVRKMLSTKSEEERKRISRELHDDTLARITDLKRYIESMITAGAMPLAEKKQLGISIQILDDVTREIRRIINALRPSMLDNVLGLIPAIENLLDELRKRSNHKIQTKFSSNIHDLNLLELEEINLYRIIQEALNNVFKHSNASKVEVSLKEQPGQILILVSDNGIGFNHNGKNSGYGLIDMKERAELIGAHVQYLNKPEGMGATLEITLPILVGEVATSPAKVTLQTR